MSKIRILIVEDELIIAEDIRIQLEDLGYEIIPRIARNYDQAIRLFLEEKPDMLLIDIVLTGKKDGIDLARKVRELSGVPIIYLTSHADRSTVERAKHTKPDAYLVKPFEKNDLYSSIEVAFHRYSEKETGEKMPDRESGFYLRDAFFIKKDHKLFKLKVSEIKYLKSEGNYIEIHSQDKIHLIRSSMKDMLNRLPANTFLQIHKSYAINMDHLDSMDYAFAQIGTEEIPVGRKYMDGIRKALNTDL